MELTSSFQLLKQIHLGNAGSGRAYLRIYARVSSTGYDIPNNRTKVYVKSTLYYENSSYFYTGPPTSKALSCTGLSWQGGDASGTYYQGETTLNETNGYITHNNDGTKTIEVSANFTSTPWGWNGTATEYATLPKIPRQANLLSAPNFNDEENPTLTFSNPGGFKIDAYIEAPGMETIIHNNIPNTGTYTFELTEEEKKQLYLATKNSNILNVTFGIQTTIGSNKYWSFLYRTMTIINGNPIFNDFEFKDINEKTINLTGNNQNVILGYSNVEVTIPIINKAIAQKEALITKYRFNNNEANYSDTEDVKIISNNVTNGEFTVYAIDSRSNSTAKIKSASSVINYNSLIKGNIFAGRQNGVSENVLLELDGKIDLVDFGSVTNSIKIARYRYKVASESEWSEFNNLTINVDENGNFTFNGLIKGDTETLGFDIQNAYNIEVYIQDELSEIKYTANFGAGIPHVAYAKNGIGIMGAYDENVGGLLQVGGKRIDNTYSTEEQIIGTYRDKPLYRKVIQTTNGSLQSILNSLNISILVNYRGWARSEYDMTWNVPCMFYNQNELEKYHIFIRKSTSSGKYNVVKGSYMSDKLSCELVLEYTKTTD